MIKPNFIGVGAMKCATTWIAECLRGHPDVFMSAPKEIHYFSRHYHRGFEWYLKHFSKVKGDLRIGEFTVDYFSQEEIPGRIFADLGMVKIIICLRDPVERFYSVYRHYLRQGELSLNAYGSCSVEKIKNLRQEMPIIFEDNKYCRNISRFIDTFGNSNVKILFKEEIDTQPSVILSELYSFLGVDITFRSSIDEKIISKSFTPKFQFLEKTRIFLYKIANRLNPSFIPIVRNSGISGLYRRLNSVNDANMDVFANKSETDEYLVEMYKKETIELHQLIQREIPYFCRYS